MRRTIRLLAFVSLTAALSWPRTAQGQGQFAEERVRQAGTILEQLVEAYGVSGDEARVREVVRGHLPEWTRPRVDSAGNLWVRVGSGDPATVFVAHLDETGFEITEIRPDGRLELRRRGGFFGWLWEATPALVHTPDGPVPGVFTPREQMQDPPRRDPPGGFQVDVGTESRPATEALGIRIGQKVTNPKQFVPLAGTRATGRSFDDRVGSTAQILALQQLNRTDLDHEVIFLWVTEEEIGLLGSRAAARELGFGAVRVYAIDTFVAADSPLDPQNFAVTPLGSGPVARAVDNSSVMPPAVLDTLRRLAADRALPLQVGTTNGGNDGSAFQAWGVVDIPIGWPLRYSHSPVEVIDLTDLVALSDIIKAIAEEW